MDSTLIGRELVIEKLPKRPTYSVCTLVSRPQEYRDMCQSFLTRGFSLDDTEFLRVDNSTENATDAYTAYNAFLLEARNPYIILCHQDIELIDDGRTRLDQIIAEMNVLDPKWGLLGNSGPREDGRLATRITDPVLSNVRFGGSLPARVVGLDENFIVVRRSANLALSHDLNGFHLYGPDLCLIADVLGVSAYVVDFHLRHRSAGRKDESFGQGRIAFRRKYERAFRSRWLQLPTLAPVFITGWPVLGMAARAFRKVGFWPRLRSKAAVPTSKAPRKAL